MATVHIRSLGVAEESSFGSLAATGLPDNTGLTFTSMGDIERASITFDGQESPSTEREDPRTAAYHRPPEPVTVYNSGTAQKRRTGTISLTVALRTIGSKTAFLTYSSVPLHRLLASGMGVHTPNAQSIAVTGAVGDNDFTVADIANLTVGELFAVDMGTTRREFSAITGLTEGGATDTVTHSPALSAGLSNETVHLCQTLYGRLGVSGLGSSVAIRADGDGWRYYANGCRMESLAVNASDRKVMLEITLRAAIIQDGHSDAAVAAGTNIVEPTYADGNIAHTIGSYAVITGSIASASAPAKLARTVVDVDEWSFSLTNTLAPRSHSDDILGMSELEVVDQTATMDLTLSVPSSTYDDDFWSATQRSVLLGFGPTGEGNGACIYLPAAHLTTDAGMRDLGGDLVRQTLNFRQGRWALDDATVAPANTHVRIGLSL